ncbi:nodulation protein NfeD, partial [Elusimicrobiota bacterium]
MKSKSLLFLLGLILILNLPAFSSEVILLEIDGTINPIVAEHISSALEKRHSENTLAAVIKMDTPGGLMDSMRQIIKAIESSDFPVIIYIGNAGARAASAGAFITMAGDIAVMAEGTNIGAAHPVKIGGQKPGEDMGKKMTEDARAFIKSLAEKHGRNSEWAQKAVTESSSITADEAVSKNVVEYVVKDFEELKTVLEGKSVVKNNREFKLTFKGAIRKIKMDPFKRFLSHIAHPNLAYIFLLLGVYGLIYEFSNPGVGLGAVVGGISILLAALSLQMIPVNLVGVLLIILGVIMLVMDIWVPSYGILTAGGLISFIIGSFTLIDVEKFPVDISISLIISAAAATGLFFVFAVSSGISIQRKKVTTGIAGMIGLEGEVRKNIMPVGEIFVRGEIWEAESSEEKIKKGSRIKVIDV